MYNVEFFKDVEFVGDERIKEIVSEQEYVDIPQHIPLIAIDNDQE